MPTMDMLSFVLNLDTEKLGKEGREVLESLTFSFFYEQITIYFISKSNQESRRKCNSLSDAKLTALIIKDILECKTYTLEGIANYARLPINIVTELTTGKKRSIAQSTMKKIISLHGLTRPELYRIFFEKLLLLISDSKYQHDFMMSIQQSNE